MSIPLPKSTKPSDVHCCMHSSVTRVDQTRDYEQQACEAFFRCGEPVEERNKISKVMKLTLFTDPLCASGISLLKRAGRRR